MGYFALDDEALKAVIKQDSSQTCGELAEHLQISDLTVRLYLHPIAKAYKFSK